MQGIIIKILSGFYYVKAENRIYTCKARGVMRKNKETPLVGDRVIITPESNGDTGIIEKIEARKNYLVRPPVANVDKAFIVSSYSTPKPNSYIIDTFTAICEYKGIEPIIVFNKADLGDFSEYIERYRSAGYKVFITSAKEGIGADELKKEFENSVSVLTGNSGVGKSSILNLFLDSVIETGEVSDKLGRGRHTTRHTEIYPLNNGGYVADTPGFSEIEAIKNDYEFKENLQYYFKEFVDYIPHCRFRGCSHTVEKGCAVLEAANSGKIDKNRLESYKMLYEELKELKKWQMKSK